MRLTDLLPIIVLLTLPARSEASVDDLEDIGSDCTPVLTRIIDGVTVEISTAGGVDVAAGTYGDEECWMFMGANSQHNTPLHPEHVSGTRFISSSVPGSVFPDAEPIIFEFDAPVTLFGLTTLDLLEECNTSDATITLRAYDEFNTILDEHTRTGEYGQSGLDLDWFVSGNQIVRVELTGGGLGDCNGYGIDDLVLMASPSVDDLEDIGSDCTPVLTRIIDGVTVEISTAGGVDVAAGTYGDEECWMFMGANSQHNTPLHPEHVSGTRFISSSVPGSVFPDAEPIIFEFDAPVTLFGLTTLDLLEECNTSDATITLRAYDEFNTILDEHTRTGEYGQSGLDLDWFVSGDQIVRVELTGGGLGDCNGYGIDDLVLYRSADPCPADFDDDGDVDTADLLHLLGCWGQACGDVDGDGDTDTADLLALLGAWGDCP